MMIFTSAIRNITIEMKIIIGIILFTLLIVSAERYQLSDNITQQFIKSKKSKNSLLINTISPVIAMNISLGLEKANLIYLDKIVKQNSDIESLVLSDSKRQTLCNYTKNPNKLCEKGINDVNFVSKNIIDSISGENLGFLYIYFSDKELKEIHDKNIRTTINIFLITLVLLFLFIFLIKGEFKELKTLSKSVLKYDPKLHNFELTRSKRLDEVGIIHNAIISMVNRIAINSRELESKVKERTKELQEVNEKLESLSITDPLTDIYNRRYFEKHLKSLLGLAKRKNIDISIIICDIDFFKEVNDTYGHLAGDIVLKKIASIMKNSLKRSSDFVARYGGEEFIIVLYDTNANEALELCQSIQTNIKNAKTFKYKDVKIRPITLSFGISSIIANAENTQDSLVHSADTALYKAKENGRDCIVVSQDK